MKIIIGLLLIIIIYSLGSALYYMMKTNRSESMVKSLMCRIGLSGVLLAFLVLAHFMGWVSPNTVVPI